MQDDKQIKVLFLPAWYPNKYDSMFGLFVQQHAKSLAPHADVCVLNLVQAKNQKERFKVSTNVDNQLTEIIIYHRASKLPLGILKKIQNGIRFIKGQKLGWQIIKQSSLEPDICHVHILTRVGILAYFLQRFQNIPYVITEHWSRYLPHNDHFSNPIHKWVTQKIIQRSSEMTSVSGVLKKAMQGKGLSHATWSLMPNVIDVKRFIPVDQQRNDKKVKLFHISCFEDKSKNISGLLRAFKEASKSHSELELNLIGDGPDWNKMREYSQELEIPENQIIFNGVLEGDELVKTMQQCDFSVLFSHYETFGIVVLESLSLGKPVIASKVGAIPEILPEKFGNLVNSGDEAGLSKAILNMVENHMHYDVDEMHAHVAERYDVNVVGFQLKRLYNQYIER